MFKKFKIEELVFVGLASSSLIFETSSDVPALFTCSLMSFYYLVFGWYIFSDINERKPFRSVIFGILYSVIWLLILVCALRMFGDLTWFFYFIKAILILSIAMYMYFTRRSSSKLFIKMNYLRLVFAITISLLVMVIR